MNNNSIEHIIAGCVLGKQDARRELYERYYGAMMGISLRYMSNRDDAKDVLHDGFIKVFGKINECRDAKSLEAWIRRIIVNTAIDFYRKKLPATTSIETIQDSLYEVSGEPEDDIIHDLTSEEILELVQKLSPAYRMTFNLYVLENLSHKEIAGRLAISEGTSKSNLSKARMRLKEMLYQFVRTSQ